METQGYRNTRDAYPLDNVLFQQALAGDQEAFEALISRYQHSLFRHIYRYVGEYHEAHDVLQQVWLQLLPVFTQALPTCACETLALHSGTQS